MITFSAIEQLLPSCAWLLNVFKQYVNEYIKSSDFLTPLAIWLHQSRSSAAARASEVSFHKGNWGGPATFTDDYQTSGHNLNQI